MLGQLWGVGDHTGARMKPRVLLLATLVALAVQAAPAAVRTPYPLMFVTCVPGTGFTHQLNTFGNRAVAHVPKLQKLMRHICNEGFEHHVVMNSSRTAAVLTEACERYLGWDVYRHEAPEV